MKNVEAAAVALSPAADGNELKYFCEKAESIAGISLKPGKYELVKTRLRSRLADNGLKTYREYKSLLEQLPPDHPEWQKFINLLTTNKTDFFREPEHFNILMNSVLPEFCKSGEKMFKVWSAASSSGEEAYTLAMILDRCLPKDVDFRILATDIDTNVLETAQNAVYPLSRKAEIPTEYHQGAIDIGKKDVKNWFRIRRHLKDKVIFKHHNLVERTSPGENVFDLILCRNVLIYFEKKSIEFVAEKLFQSTKSGGFLFIGHSESLQGVPKLWTSAGPSVFRKVP